MGHGEPRQGYDGESEPPMQKLYVELHRKYIVALQDKRSTFGDLIFPLSSSLKLPSSLPEEEREKCIEWALYAEYAVTEHLRMSGVYWGLTAMYLMSAQDQMKTDEIVQWVIKCQHSSVFL